MHLEGDGDVVQDGVRVDLGDEDEEEGLGEESVHYIYFLLDNE